MKKLMVAAAIAVAAVVSQAAQVQWTANYIYTPETIGGTSPQKLAGAYYMCFLTEDVNGVWDKTISIDDATALAAAGKFNGDDGLLAYAAKKGTMTTAGSVSSGMLTGYGAGDSPVKGFLIILDTASVDTADKFMITAEATTGSFTKDSTTAKVAAGSQAANSWQTVNIPEPTSGLLLLLGVAGMALRRRRA